jgi:hypothetical protein
MQSENKTNTTIVSPRSQTDGEWLRPVGTETDRDWPRLRLAETEIGRDRD